ncbi:isoaspartyl peptidase/L-asparaginase [candidate division WOR-3 bacterium]|nr:isoaspartyl peptidase/L-asparaginase [candidate division WOR-3 bacterium]
MMLLTNCEGGVGMSAAREVLERGGSALDAVEAGIRAVEADTSIDSVGRGGAPDLFGVVSCDAAVMDGANGRTGAVANLRYFLHAVSVARQVMERLPHVFLVSEGAERFAQDIGAERAEMLTDEARVRYDRWMVEHAPVGVEPVTRAHLGHNPDGKMGTVPRSACVKRAQDTVGTSGAVQSPFSGRVTRANLSGEELVRLAWESSRDKAAGGTVVFLCRDGNGDIAAGASTSGWAQCYPGRLGDSPIIGAGLYADNRYGACGCTHVGEATIRACTARSVVQYMKAGASVQEACLEAVRDLRFLRGGFLGPVIIHAIDRRGESFVVSTGPVVKGLDYFRWCGDGEVETCTAGIAGAENRS